MTGKEVQPCSCVKAALADLMSGSGLGFYLLSVQNIWMPQTGMCAVLEQYIS